ncbi:unnamed protein product, partial [Laminaria digitata]
MLAQANNGQQRRAGNPAVLARKTVMIENTSGLDIDVLRVTNGQYQVVAVARTGFATPINTYGSEQLYLGAGGQSIIGSYTVPFPESGPLRLGPDVLARA